MRFILIASLCLAASVLLAFPIERFDYHTPDHNPSPLVTAMGGLNLTDISDYYLSYDNPALLAFNKTTSTAASFSIVKNDDFTPYDLMKVGSLLKNNQFSGIVINSSTGAMMYQSVASVHINQPIVPGSSSNIYFDYALQKAQMSFGGTSGKAQNFAAGLSVKYLFGRLVYLERNDIQLTFTDFKDDKVKGVSTDLGFAYKTNSTSVGLAFYDILNGLFWQTESNKTLTRRGAFGVQFGQEDLKILAGVMTTIESDPIKTYHFGIVKDVNVGGAKQDKQMIGFRAGAYSDKFSDSTKIFYSVGSGYYYKTFRIDFSIVGPGLKIEQCNYLFSVSLSM
jgi:hypothetical protein